MKLTANPDLNLSRSDEKTASEYNLEGGVSQAVRKKRVNVGARWHHRIDPA